MFNCTQGVRVLVSVIPQLFEETEANVTTNYKLPVTTELWTEAMWIVVYICQIFWLVYALTAICRQTPSGPVYNHPKLLPVTVHIFFVIAVIQQVVLNCSFYWLFFCFSVSCRFVKERYCQQRQKEKRTSVNSFFFFQTVKIFMQFINGMLDCFISSTFSYYEIP